jgi:hypothetical protein
VVVQKSRSAVFSRICRENQQLLEEMMIAIVELRLVVVHSFPWPGFQVLVIFPVLLATWADLQMQVFITAHKQVSFPKDLLVKLFPESVSIKEKVIVNVNGR